MSPDASSFASVRQPVDVPPPARGCSRERILVLDGAMGTMIQRHKLGEADYRGERFANHARDLKGNNDLLVLTRPDVIARHPRRSTSAPAATSSRPTPSRRTSIAQADYGLEAIVYELNVAAAQLAQARLRRRGPRRRPTSRASSPARSARPTARCRCRPTSTTRRSAPSPSTRCAPPTPSRCAASSTAASTCCWPRRSSTRSTSRPCLVAIEEVFAEKRHRGCR